MRTSDSNRFTHWGCPPMGLVLGTMLLCLSFEPGCNTRIGCPPCDTIEEEFFSFGVDLSGGGLDGQLLLAKDGGDRYQFGGLLGPLPGNDTSDGLMELFPSDGAECRVFELTTTYLRCGCCEVCPSALVRPLTQLVRQASEQAGCR